LHPGAAAITISGTAVSLQIGGQSVVVGSQTLALGQYFTAATTRGGEGLAGAIATIGGFNLQSAPASPTTTHTQVSGGAFNGSVQFTGLGNRATRGLDGLWIWMVISGGAMVIVGWL